MRAVTRGLLDARVDQDAGTVTVTRSVQREFGPAQWAGLQSKLRSWRENVAALSTAVEGAGRAAGGAGPA